MPGRRPGERTCRSPFSPSPYSVVHLLQSRLREHVKGAKFHMESYLLESKRCHWLWVVFGHYRSILTSLTVFGRYSLTSPFRKWLTIYFTFFQDFKLAGSWLSNFPGGRELNGLLIRKWFGVRDISFSGRSATIVSGLEINIASVSTKIVMNTLSYILLEPRMINRVGLAVWIKRSQIPPKWGP